MQPIWATKNAAALQVLQSAQIFRQAGGGEAGAGALVVPGNTRAATSGLSGPLRQAQSVISESLFSAGVVDVNQMKIHLMERLGKELGLSMDDFDSGAAFGKAVKQAISAIRMTENGDLRLREIGDKLELDKLGISLDTLVEAMVDPGGDADKKLEAALMKQASGGEERTPAAVRRYEL